MGGAVGGKILKNEKGSGKCQKRNAHFYQLMILLKVLRLLELISQIPLCSFISMGSQQLSQMPELFIQL